MGNLKVEWEESGRTWRRVKNVIKIYCMKTSFKVLKKYALEIKEQSTEQPFIFTDLPPLCDFL